MPVESKEMPAGKGYGLAMPSDLSSSFPTLQAPYTLAATSHRKYQYGEHLYLRKNVYYFRYTFPHTVVTKLGHREIRLSLKTAYVREAKRLAVVLTGALTLILSGDCMLTYQEIRARMNSLLQKFLMQDAQKFGSRNFCIPDLEIDISPAELYASTLHLYKQKITSQEAFQELADRCVPRLIEKGVFTAEEVTDDNKLLIAKAFAEMEVTYCDIMRKKEEGDFFAETQVLATHIPSASMSQGIPQEPSFSITYKEAVEKYVQEKLDDEKWKKHSLPDHKFRIGSFLEIMGDMPVSGITSEHMREFRNTLRKLPPNRSRSKAYAGKSIDAILAMRPAKTLDIKTVNITVEAVGSLLDWCVDKRYMEHNPAKRLQIKDKRQAIDLRDAFSMEDLELVFSHPKFTDGTFKYPAYFWIPLIGLYSGMRLEEIAQLHCTDVYESEAEKLWVFDINERGTDEHGRAKTVKNINANRLVPIHDDLVTLGLLKYHKSVAAKGHIRLFPELTKTGATAKFGKQPGKQFKSVVVAQLDEHSKKSFHSLRHTFADFYKQRGWQTDMFRQLYGHEIPALSANQYGAKFPPKLLYSEVISKLDYGLDLADKFSQSKYIRKK